MGVLLDGSAWSAGEGVYSVLGAAIALLTYLVKQRAESARRKAYKDIKTSPGHRMPGDNEPPYDASAYERAIQQQHWEEKRALNAQIAARDATIERLRLEHENELRALAEAWQIKLDNEIAAAERRCQDAIEQIREAAPAASKLPPAARTPGSSPGLPPIVEEDTRRTGRPPRPRKL